LDELTLARAIHVFAVVAWIGGVYLVTMVLLPAGRDTADVEERIRVFEAVENRFGKQAKLLTLTAGASGFYMLHLLDGWERYASLENWWLHGMTLVWAIFTLVLFIFEPWFLHDWFTFQLSYTASPSPFIVEFSGHSRGGDG
jgi:uncharacterized membrane protein